MMLQRATSTNKPLIIFHLSSRKTMSKFRGNLMKTIRMHLYFLLFIAVFLSFPLIPSFADYQNIPLPEPLSMSEAIHIAL